MKNCGIDTATQTRVAVEGYLWGSDPKPLLLHLSNDEKFDIIILSDTVKQPYSPANTYIGIQSLRTSIPSKVPSIKP